MPTLSFKVSDDEALAIRRQARRVKLTVSEFLRRRARGDIQMPASIRTVRCDFTGATIFEGSADLPPLNTETVRELLADFP